MTKYEPYEKYKISKIPGLPKIPTHWIESKWRYVTELLTDYTANGSFKGLADNVQYLNEPAYARLIRLTDLRTGLKNDGIYVDEASYNYLKKSSLHGGEFLIANVGAYAGLVMEMPKYKGLATLGPNMMMARFYEKKINTRYMVYAANSEYIQKQLYLKATASSAQPKLNKEDFRSIQFLLPPLNEQTKIVDFLDNNVLKIDQLIKSKEYLIHLLSEKRQAIITESVTKGLNPDAKMKDSGIAWIGEIPKHWNITKLKFIGEAITGLTYSPNDISDESGTIVLRSTNIQKGKISLHDNVYVNMQIPSKLYTKKDDILICSRNGSRHLIGKNALIQEEEGLTFGAFTTVFRSKYNHFLYFVLNSGFFAAQLGTYLTTTINQLTIGNLKNMEVVLPPLSEQIQIIEFLKKETKEIDDLIADIEIQIKKMKEYRQSLIYEVVTGKIDVLDTEDD